MRYAVMLRSTCRFVRCVDNPDKIAVFDCREAAEGLASQYGTDAGIVEIGVYHA